MQENLPNSTELEWNSIDDDLSIEYLYLQVENAEGGKLYYPTKEFEHCLVSVWWSSYIHIYFLIIIIGNHFSLFPSINWMNYAGK